MPNSRQNRQIGQNSPKFHTQTASENVHYIGWKTIWRKHEWQTKLTNVSTPTRRTPVFSSQQQRNLSTVGTWSPIFRVCKNKFKNKPYKLLLVEVLSFESVKKSKNFDQTCQQRGPMLQAWKNVRFNNKKVSKNQVKFHCELKVSFYNWFWWLMSGPQYLKVCMAC